jgi:hypothetical protein
MKPEELRIGNYVTSDNDFAPIAIEASDFIVMERRPNDHGYNPIKITAPGGLTKLGFGTEVDEYQLCDPDSFCLKIGRKAILLGLDTQTEGVWIVLYREDIGLDFVRITEVQFIHELQNLVFALTGEELKLTM